MSSPLAAYLQSIRQIRASGAATPEMSYYGALETLINTVGSELSPKVHAVSQASLGGAGQPDGAVFADAPGSEPRSLIEIKPPDDDSWRTAKGNQVTKYWNRTPLVLVTNYRDFVVVGQNELTTESRIEETFRLVDDENAFWTKPVAEIVAEKEVELLDFLTAFLRRNAPIREPHVLAEQLAYYARLARERIVDLPADDLTTLREAFEGALGIQFQTEEAEKLFFRSALVQTLFYGLFSAWVLWAEKTIPNQYFDWRITAYVLNVPVVDVMFAEFAKPQRLRRLDIIDLLALAGSTLNQVDRDAFLQKFRQDQAVTYFYEPFLAAFDPELRDELGVWYTPPEIVKYQVARIHRTLQEELGVVDGLANPDVVILDPCVGTGSYLLEVAETIYRTHVEKGEGGQAIVLTREALTNRVIGFELLTAPFVIAHLQMNYFLTQHDTDLDYADRMPVYLTNALTGWRARPEEFQQVLEEIRRLFPELEQEVVEADTVKREEPIMVVLGNPPYNAYAGVGEAEEADLVEPYKQGLKTPIAEGGWGIKKFNLDELYVRFYRLAERQIAESGRVDRGIVCYISNNSYIEEQSFTVMRQHLLENFRQIWVDNLHGDRLHSERTPAGNVCETIFAMGPSAPGIKVGTAIAMLVHGPDGNGENTHALANVRYRDVWGGGDRQTGRAADKRQELLDSLDVENAAALYRCAQPAPATRYALRPTDVSQSYADWPRLTDLASIAPINGLMEKRTFALIDMDRDSLEERMRAYYNPEVSNEEVTSLHEGLMKRAARFDPEQTRRRLLNESRYRPENLRRYAFKPLDHRWAYIEPIRPLWNEPRPTLLEQAWDGNRFLLSRKKGVRDPEGAPLYFTSILGDNDLQTGHAYYYPLRLRTQMLIGNGDDGVSINANLSSQARDYLERISIAPDDPQNWELVWMHALAVGYAPAYIAAEADGIRLDWPRIPMPEDAEALRAGAILGERVAALLDPDVPVKGVTTGTVRPLLKSIGYLARAYDAPEDREVTEYYRGTGKVIERPRTNAEWADLEAEAAALETSVDDLVALLGGAQTVNLVWNGDRPDAKWQNVPVAAWEYVIGGYPVLKTWLGYRYIKFLERPLTQAELRHVRDLARRMTALVLLGPELDEHYRRSKALAEAWDTVEYGAQR